MKYLGRENDPLLMDRGKIPFSKSCSAAPASEVNTGRLDEDGWTMEARTDGTTEQLFGVVRFPSPPSASVSRVFTVFSHNRGGREKGRKRENNFPRPQSDSGGEFWHARMPTERTEKMIMNANWRENFAPENESATYLLIFLNGVLPEAFPDQVDDSS